jgi:hypothetical protein
MIFVLVGLLVLVAMLVDVVFGSPSVVVTLLSLPGLGYRRLRRARVARLAKRRDRRERRQVEQAWRAQQRLAKRASRKARGKPGDLRPEHAGAQAAPESQVPAVPEVAALTQDAQRSFHTPAWPLRSYRGDLPPFAPCRGELEQVAPATSRSADGERSPVRGR